MDRREPFTTDDAKAEVVRRLQGGSVVFTVHANRAMAADKVLATEVTSLLRAGFSAPAEFEGDEWRYRFTSGTRALYVVVAFAGEHELRIVTVWRRKR